MNSSHRHDSILVVDDSTANLQLLNDLLTEHGYVVYPASDGELALEFLRTTLPDLILLDIRMPEMNGYEVCRRLKADKRTSFIPIIFISGLEDKINKVKGFQQGAVDYITKPFQPEEVLVRIKTHLRLHKLTVQLEQEVHHRTEELATANQRLKQELTERKRTEEELRASEAKYRIVAENTYDWEFWTDANGQYLYISPSCQRITGYPAEEFKANPALLDSLILPDDRQSYGNHLEEMKAGQAAGSVEFRIFDKDGQVRWIEHFCQPVFDEEGKWLGTRGSNREVTKRKETEKLKQLTTSILAILNEPADLTESITRILETIKEAIAFDAVGLRLQSGEDFPYFASTGFPEDFLLAENSLVVPDRDGGLCRDENGNVCLECTCGLVISGKTDPSNPLFTPGGSCWTNNSLPLLELPADQDPRLNPRNLCIHKDFYSVALFPIHANNQIIGLLQLNDHKKDRLTRDMIAYFEDICASIGLSLMKKQAEQELRDLNATLEQRVNERTARLKASNQELEDFCYTVSHDLRAPLRHVDGYIELLVSRCRDELSEQGRHYVDTIAASARQMGVLIDDLLQFSRTGRVEMRQGKIDMNLVLQEALTPVREACAGRNIDWVLGELPQVRGDAALLRQVWANLLENAAKYSRSREAVRIEVGCRKEKDEIVFFVADNGVGFDMQYAGKLFGVFQRLHAQEEFEGTGIGLATVQRIVARHGGRVWAEAEQDRGATFYFALPAFK